MGNRLRMQNTGFKELIKDMKIHRITKIDFMHIARLGLREVIGRQGFRENYLVVSGVERAAEGEI